MDGGGGEETNEGRKKICGECSSVFSVSGLSRDLMSILSSNAAASTATSTNLRENAAHSVYRPTAVIRNHTD